MCNHNNIHPKDRISPSSVYYCPMECEGEKVYFVQGKRCPTCNMFLVPIEEKEEFKNKPQTFSKTNLPESFAQNLGKYYCPMFCEGDKVYDDNIGCPVCHMHLEVISEDLLVNLPQKKEEKNIDFQSNAGKFYCPMFCEDDKVYDQNIGCPVCGMDLVQIPSKNEIIEDNTTKILTKKLWISTICTFIVLFFSMGGMFIRFPFSNQLQGVIELIFTIPVVFFSGWFLIKRGWISFKTGNLNMFSLIALGIISALIFSIIALIFPNIFPHEMRHSGKVPLYFESVCTIITLVIFGQLMEAKAHKKTGKAIEELINLSPDEANLVIDNQEKRVSISEVKVGDILRVKPGEKIPVDGKVLEGNSSIDESMITGEPIPSQKNENQSVTAGTINGNGTFLMIAEKIGSDTLLAKIIDMVNSASRSKAPIQKLADKISKIFVPTVILISLITFILWYILGKENNLSISFINAVAVLVIACPCALGLATPMSLMVGIGKGAKNGLLIKNAEAIEQLNAVNVLITDKTGTLTEGKPTLDFIQTFSNWDNQEILKLSASLSIHSQHPLSNSISEFYNKKSTEIFKVDNFENIAGKGIIGIIDNNKYLLGNEALMKDFNIPLLENQKEAKTFSYLAKNQEIIAVLYFSDKIKPTAKKAINYLKNKEIEVIMMTGDNAQTAEMIAKELDISRFVSHCLPQDKMNEIKKLQSEGKIVAMAGDGINDAPALAQANIGIAMGTGSDIAIESAEITLVKGDILGIVKAHILSKSLLKNIKQNLFFAFIYNTLGIPIAAGLLYPIFGILLSPMFAAAAMSFSSLSVIINSLRLNKTYLNP